VAAGDRADPDDPRLWSDTIHPDDLGHQLIADRLAPVLQAALAGRPGGVASAASATVRG
jgi:lysophospholipase L1-like esterase